MKRGRVLKYIFIAPGILWVLGMVIYPLLNSLTVSFFNYVLGRGRVSFRGVSNYVEVLNDPRVWHSSVITLIYVAASVSVEMLLGVFLAWCFTKKIRLQGFLKSIFISPLFTVTVAVGYIGVTIFHETGGPVNAVLGLMGLSPVPWLSEGSWALFAVILGDIWRWTPFVFIISFAAFQSVPMTLKEAALLDTSSDWQLFRYVSFPTIKSSLLLILALRLVWSFRAFGLPFGLTRGGPDVATEIYTILTYRKAMKFFDFGHGSAMAYILLIAVLLITYQLFKVVRKAYFK